MTRFGYRRAEDVSGAIANAAEPGAAIIAGGTDLLQLVHEGIALPSELVDITNLPLRGVATIPGGVRIEALTTLAETAAEPAVRDYFPAVARALEETASPQVRNMATMGGNLLQRPRCPYFRDPAVPCNKRLPGSGCSARQGHNRMHAIFGASDHCIAAHPSDLAVALVAYDAELILHGRSGERSVPVEDLYRLPGDTPHIETILEPGEIIASIRLPMPPEPQRARYLKVRDRASFEWALVSCAAVLTVEDNIVAEARLAVGGVATKPWRLRELEDLLVGQELEPETIERIAAHAADGAEPADGNAFKVPLLQRTVARALGELAGAP